MSIHLREEKPNEKGEKRLTLDIYHEGKRLRRAIKGLVILKGNTKEIREKNNDTWKKAEDILSATRLEFSTNHYQLPEKKNHRTIVVDWMQGFIDGYKLGDKRNCQGVLDKFKEFLLEEKHSQKIRFDELNPQIIQDFANRLKKQQKGEGAHSYFARFKKMMKAAKRSKVMDVNPAEEVQNSAGEAKEKDVLTLKEIQLLVKTPTEAKEMRRAFLFSCMTGLRFVDVKSLTWGDVRHEMLRKTQDKTKHKVGFVLNDAAKELLGKPGKNDELVFATASANGWNKSLKLWVKRAEIDKHITWHCARHSVGTNLALNKEDVTTIQHILGHKTLKYTGRYVHAAKEISQVATNKLVIQL